MGIIATNVGVSGGMIERRNMKHESGGANCTVDALYITVEPLLKIKCADVVEQALKDILSHLHNIQRSQRGSIGAPNNVYLPQLWVDLLDELAARVMKLL